MRLGRRLAAVSALVVLALGTGCRGGVGIHVIQSEGRPPSNVTALCQIDGASGPLEGLGKESFHVFEDGIEITGEGGPVIASPDMRDRQRSFLLLDVGNNPSPADLEAMGRAAKAFVDGVGAPNKVAVYAFDGAAEPTKIVGLESSQADADSKLDAFGAFKPADPSTNLHGAIKTGLEMLREQMSGMPLTSGNLVIVSRGRDRAARASEREVEDYIDAKGKGIPIWTIAVGSEAKDARVDGFGTEPPIEVATTGDLEPKLKELATLIDARGKSFYIITYCSLARGGEHETRIEMEHVGRNEKGEEVKDSARATFKFGATGFAPGCVPTIPKELETSPPSPNEAEKEKPTEPKKPTDPKAAKPSDPKTPKLEPAKN